tara:strand:- start:2580 stop:4205 length:1626 start_codon:yes stop_codon:yes gene_type:complete
MFENYDQLIANKTSLEQATDIPSIVGEIELTHFNLISPNNYPGARIDLRRIMSKFEIVENIFSPYISGYIEITDSIGLYEKIPIIGEEYFHLSFKSRGAPQSDLINRFFRIVRVINFNRDANNDRVHTYRLEFVSIEHIHNLKSKVQKSYDRLPISFMVQDVYDNYIKSTLEGFEQDIEIESTEGDHNLVIPNLTPFETMSFLANRAISSKNVNSKGAFFTFYDTVKDGFKFSSIETMIQENIKNFTYTYSPSNIPGLNELEKLSYGSKLIKDFSRVSAMNVEENLKTGMYANRLITHNILRMRYDVHDTYYKKPRGYSQAATFDRETGASIQPDQILSNVFANNVYSIFANDFNERLDESNHIGNNPVISLNADVLGSPQSNVSLVPSNQGCLKFKDPDNTGKYSDNNLRETRIEKWHAQRRMQMKLLNSFIYEVVVPGNSHRSVGDIINLEIPSSLLEAISSTTRTELQSNALASGSFLVTRLSHVFVNTHSHIEYDLDMHVMKDTLSRKLPIPTTNALTYAEQQEGEAEFATQGSTLQ